MPSSRQQKAGRRLYHPASGKKRASNPLCCQTMRQTCGTSSRCARLVRRPGVIQRLCESPVRDLSRIHVESMDVALLVSVRRLAPSASRSLDPPITRHARMV